LDTILNAVPFGLYHATLSGRFLTANARLAEMLGYPDLQALLASSSADHYHDAADRDRLLAQLDRDGATGEVEALLRRHDGSTFHAEIFARRIDGPEPCSVGMINDITARKQLQADADRFARAAAASGEVIFMTDRDGWFTYVNPEFTRVYGYEAGEIVGLRTPAILRSGLHSSAHYAAFWAALLDGRGFRGEFINRRRSGESVLVEASVSPVFDDGGAIAGFLAIQRDITARRQTEEALHRSEALFRRIFDHLPVGAALVSVDGRVEHANHAYCGIMGRSEAELRNLTFLDLTHPEDRNRSAEASQALRTGTIDGIELEKRFVRPDGRAVWGAVSVRQIKDSAGQTLWTMPVIVDVTERRKLEEELRQSQKMEAVGQLAGGVAHDFNNLLMAILGYAELALAGAGDNKGIAADLRQIQEAGQRAASLTRQLLAFSRKQVLQLEVVDVNHAIERLQGLVRPLIGEDIDLRLQLSPAPALVRADATQFEQVALNLIVNARDAMPHGGTILIRTAVVPLRRMDAPDHPDVPDGDYVQLVIEDTGCGMDEDVRRRLFEPFFTTKPPGKGSGLGLAVAYGIVKQMEGYIWFYSEPGRGTTFKIYLPLAGAATQAAAPASTPAGRPAGSERLLLVEDDEVVRAFAAEVLCRHGYEVILAGNGAEALERLEERGAPDLIVTDMIMPSMSGWELAERAARQYPDVRILFTSGYVGHRPLPGGPDVDLLEKPFTVSSLLGRVRRVLDGEPQHHAGRQHERAVHRLESLEAAQAREGRLKGRN
jgi:two-component system, cell cycle sensor histidine kinase and response regulator CckA